MNALHNTLAQTHYPFVVVVGLVTTMCVSCSGDDIDADAGGSVSAGGSAITAGSGGDGGTGGEASGGAGGEASGSGGAGGEASGGGGAGGEASGGGGAGGDGGGPVDSCPVATNPWTTDHPPAAGNFGSNPITREKAVLQLTGSGPRIYVTERWQNGSFYDANVRRLVLENGIWTKQGVANEPVGLTIGTSIGVTHGPNPCVAYIRNYNAQLKLKCDNSSELTVAPTASGGVKMGEVGSAKLLIYRANAALQAVTVDPTAGPPVQIDSAWTIGATSLRIDDSGVPHVAYVASESNGERRIKYASRDNGSWTTEVITVDTWTGNPNNEGDSVSLALVDDEPVVAYHRRDSRSVALARRMNGSFASVVVEAPAAGFPNDTAGTSLALEADCMGRLHIAYHRYFSTDDPSNLRLFVGRIENDSIIASEALPVVGSPPFYPAFDSLGFVVGDGGEQTVAARTSFSTSYFASR